MDESKLKPIDFLKNLNTKRLLAYYKARRGEAYVNTRCECCGEFMWDLYQVEYAEQKELFNVYKNHLSKVKSLLDSREHVET